MGDGAPRAVLGFVLLGGSMSGALVRDVRLANELARRGYEVHVWWAMDRSGVPALAPAVRQHLLFNGARYIWPRVGGAMERLAVVLGRMFSDGQRAHWVQRRPRLVRRMMGNLTSRVCDGIERERVVVRRFARSLDESGVTHVLPMLEFLGPWVEAARKLVARPIKYLVTFQGYELYSTYARAIGREKELYDRLKGTVAASDYPAIAVSEDYLQRVVEEIGVPESALRAIPPGIPYPPENRVSVEEAERLIAGRFQGFDPRLPLVTYLGRRDAEKGIDLLVYAAAMLKRRGQRFQLAICGPTLFGDHYGRVCRQIAEEVRCLVLWRRFVPDEVRAALFTASRCIVYPSIHREPFGMVAAEAISYGVPAIVPDLGGVQGAVEVNGSVAGLKFKVWDSGDLAEQIGKLLADDGLRARLVEAGPRVAEHFSIERLGERVLGHLGF